MRSKIAFSYSRRYLLDRLLLGVHGGERDLNRVASLILLEGIVHEVV